MSRRSTTSINTHRANSAPEDLPALSDPFFDLDLQNRLPRTRSFSVADQPSTRDGETPPSTPPDLHFLQNVGLPHPRSSQQTSVGPNIPVIQIPAAQVNPLPQQNIIMATWYAPLVLPQPLLPLPNDYQSKIPHFPAKEPTTAQQHVDKMEDSFDYMEIDDETIKMRIFAQSLGGEHCKCC